MVYTITPERAVEILDPKHREHYDSIDPVNEACKMGMQAIKRIAIPKKVDFVPSGHVDGTPKYDIACCTTCGATFGADDVTWKCNFCPQCGQRLEWR